MLDSPDTVTPEPVSNCVVREVAILNPSNTVRCGHPKRTFAIFEQGLDATPHQPLFCSECCKASIFEKAQTGSSSDPEIAFAIFTDGLDRITGESFISGEGGELPIQHAH